MDFNFLLQQLKEQNLFRKLKTLTPINAVHFDLNGKRIINFASNDYLGLSQDPRVIEAAKEGLSKFGFGSGASRLVSGNFQIHDQLEEKLASFKKKDAAIVFSTGYMANVGVINSVVGKGDGIFIDKLSHASIIDACLMNEADLRVFPHKNYERLLEQLKNSKAKKKLIITDSVFSMDGDLADLKKLVQIKNETDALLMIDEAHGTGVFGKEGRGLAEAEGVEDEVDISMGTLSKALGGFGGFVAGKKDLITLLQNKARSFIYTTGIPPHVSAGLIKAIEIIETEPELREKLWENIQLMRAESPIIPIIVGENEAALNLSKQLLEEGFFLQAMRYPTVPKGKARLRLTLSASHTRAQIEKLYDLINVNYAAAINS